MYMYACIYTLYMYVYIHTYAYVVIYEYIYIHTYVNVFIDIISMYPSKHPEFLVEHSSPLDAKQLQPPFENFSMLGGSP